VVDGTVFHLSAAICEGCGALNVPALGYLKADSVRDRDGETAIEVANETLKRLNGQNLLPEHAFLIAAGYEPLLRKYVGLECKVARESASREELRKYTGDQLIEHLLAALSVRDRALEKLDAMKRERDEWKEVAERRKLDYEDIASR
jgi:hypothetical protein